MPSASTSEPRVVQVAFERLPGWIDRFGARHPGTRWNVAPDAVAAASEDGSTASFAVPFAPLAEPTLAGLRAHLVQPRALALLIVRRGGFAVAWVVGGEVVDSKVGRRHVQGRSKAGGWSQQRFARRRENQARAAYAAAAGHARDLLAPRARECDLVVAGGDRQAVAEVLADPALAALAERPRQWLGGLGEPRRDTLRAAVARARSVSITVVDTAER